MNRIIKNKYVTISLIACSLLACQPHETTSGSAPGADVKLNTDEGRGSYALGQNVGRGIKTQGVKVNARAFQAGVSDALNGTNKLTDDETKTALSMMQKTTMQNLEAAGEKNGKEGAEFLVKNRNVDGWKVSPSGLQYKVIKEGKGATPAPMDFVKIDYVGTLIDGNKFESTIDEGKPALVAMHGVIPAWTEALKMMKPGGEMKLAVPPALAYGQQPHGVIGPNSTVLFDLTLIEINPSPSSQTKPSGVQAPPVTESVR